MRIRNYNPETDLTALREMHAQQGFEYLFPDLDHPRFFTKLVVEDEDGNPVMALVGKLTAEMMFFLFPEEGTPKQRLEGFLALHQASEQEMAEFGLDECFAEIPPGPRMEKFKRLLAFLGWVPMREWAPWCRPFLSRKPEIPTRFRRLLDGDREHTAIER